MTEIIEKEEYKPLQRGYLIAYLPFKANLKKCKNKNNELFPTNLNTKLMIKSVTDVIGKKIANYNLYDAEVSAGEKEEVKKLVSKKYLSSNYENYINQPKDKPTREILRCKVGDIEYPKTISDIEEVIQNHVGAYSIKDVKDGKCTLEQVENNEIDNEKVNKHNSSIKIDCIDLSLYDDGEKVKLGFLKVRIRIDYSENFDCKERIQALSDVYDVISRNLKEKDKISKKLDLGFNTSELCKAIGNYSFKYLDGKNYTLDINENNVLFNYGENDKRCYTFSYITINEKIDDYIEKSILDEYKGTKECLYHLSRIHENGTIRTYNKKNDIFTYYMDDTSVLWGVSRVGLGALSIHSEREELYRNIKVMNSDFSFLYEFALHQKFYYYLMSFTDDSIKTTVEKKEKLFDYIKTFCPKIVSEFETQEIYEAIKSKLEIEELLEDAKSSIKVLETKDEAKRKTLFTRISSLIFAIGVPITIYEYIKNIIEIDEELTKAKIDALNPWYIKLIAIVLIVAISYIVARIFHLITDSRK